MREIKFRAWNGGEMIRMEGISWSMFWDEVDQDHTDSVLMQFTGLKDKNDKEIYEGDLVRSYNEIQKVVWSKAGANFLLRNKKGSPRYFACRKRRIVEVVGNIYETPELLK